MAEPVSWLLIERGWSVVDGSGADIGAVTAVIGDKDADIFHGLHVHSGEEERYVAADRVGTIEEGRVRIRAGFDELDPTPAPREPGGAEISRDRDAEL